VRKEPLPQSETRPEVEGPAPPVVKINPVDPRIALSPEAVQAAKELENAYGKQKGKQGKDYLDTFFDRAPRELFLQFRHDVIPPERLLLLIEMLHARAMHHREEAQKYCKLYKQWEC
jgi:hypothetical protein